MLCYPNLQTTHGTSYIIKVAVIAMNDIHHMVGVAVQKLTYSECLGVFAYQEYLGFKNKTA